VALVAALLKAGAKLSPDDLRIYLSLDLRDEDKVGALAEQLEVKWKDFTFARFPEILPPLLASLGGGDGVLVDGTPFLFAAMEGTWRKEAVPILLKAGANPNRKGPGGVPPLTAALRQPRNRNDAMWDDEPTPDDLVLPLIEAGAEVDAADGAGKKPIQAVLRDKDLELTPYRSLVLMLKRGAKAEDMLGPEPLKAALESHPPALAAALLAGGLSGDIPADKRPLLLAAACAYDLAGAIEPIQKLGVDLDVSVALEDLGALPEAPRNWSWNKTARPFTFALAGRSSAATRALLKAGAAIDYEKDSFDIMWATRRNPGILDMVLEFGKVPPDKLVELAVWGLEDLETGRRTAGEP
jgi:hypothetical protein